MGMQIDRFLQSMASDAYKKTLPKNMIPVENKGTADFKSEYLGALVNDYFYSGTPEDHSPERKQQLKKLKSTIEALKLPQEFKIAGSSEELSLETFLKVLEKQVQDFEADKEEKIKEEADKIKKLSPEEMENILSKAKDELTVGDIEKYRKGAISERIRLPEEMSEQIRQQFQKYGLEASDENAKMAKRLLEKGIVLSETVCSNIENLSRLKSIELSEARVRDLAEQYASVQKISLKDLALEYPMAEAEVEKMVEELANLKPDYLNRIGKHFRTIEEALSHYHDSFLSEQAPAGGEEHSADQISFQYIRYQMTMEKAMILNRRGIAVDKTELTLIERELIRLALTEESFNIDRLERASRTEMIQKVLEVEHSKIRIWEADWKGIAAIQTTQSFGQIALAMQPATEALYRYESLSTQVRKDLGDSMQKAIVRLQSLLLANKMEVNDANLRAAQILGRAEVEITEANLERIQELHQKLQSVFHALTPSAVLSLLSAGSDVLGMSLDELSVWGEQRDKKSIESLKDRVAKQIYRMEKRKEITPEEKEKLILFYRLLQQVEKTDGAAIALLMRDGRSIHLESLFDAAKYLEGHHVDLTADAGTGLSESEFVDLKTQIRNGFFEKKREIRSLVRDAVEELLDGEMEQPVERLQMLKTYSLKDLEMLFQTWKNPTVTDAEMYQELQKVPFLWSDSLRRLEKAVEKNEKAKDKWQKIKAVLESAESDRESLIHLLRELEGDLLFAENLEERELFGELMRVKEQFSYQQRLEDNQDFYQIPLWVNQSIRQITMYFPGEKQEKVQETGELKVFLSFEETTFGNLSALLTIRKNTGSLLIRSEYGREESLRNLKNEICNCFAMHHIPLTSYGIGDFPETRIFGAREGEALLREEFLTEEEKMASAEDFPLENARNILRNFSKDLAKILYS